MTSQAVISRAGIRSLSSVQRSRSPLGAGPTPERVLEAFVVAKTKAKLTGRIYRLVNGEGEVLEEVRHLGSSFGRGAD